MQAKLLSVLFIPTCALFTALADAAPRKTASVEGITEYQFDNGLRALLYPDNSQSKVTVNMTVLVGSRQEGYGETGMAHLLEHMVFKGTPQHPKIPKVLQEHGAQFNGSTSDDRVNYFETLAATDDNLEFALDLEADRLVNSFIKAEDLESEMTVVRNEFERGENSPGAVLGERVAAAAYDWHNYGKPTIGNRTDIERVPVENLRAFYKKYYQPDNIVLIVAGKFDETKALALIEKYFGVIPRPERKLTPTYTEEPPQDGEHSVILRRVGDVSGVRVAWHIPAAAHKDSAALEVLAGVLRTQPSGRLYTALVETKKASSVSAFAGREHDPGLMMVAAEVAHGSTPEEVRDIILSTVEGISGKAITAEEVNRSRQQILKQRELAANNTAQIGIALSEWAAEGDWRLYFLHRDFIEQVTPESVQHAAAQYLQRNNRTVGMFIPAEKAERIAVPPTPDIAALVSDYKGRVAIAEGEVFEATPENIEARVQRVDLAGGIKATLLQKKTRGQEAHLVLTLRYGNEENLKGFESVAAFLPELMLRGTKKLNHQQLRDELDKLSATLSAGAGGGGRRGGGRRGGGPATVGAGSVTFSIQAKRETLPATIQILAQVLREATLPAGEFAVLKGERLAALEQMRTEPSMLAPRLLQRELNIYPKDDVRYVTTIEESIQRCKDVRHEQVTQLYRQYLSSQSAEVTIVGDFDPKACRAALEPALRGWAAAKPYARVAMPITANPKGAQHQIRTPDKANATYIAGLLFPLRDDDPDYAALLIGNHIFGAGALSSRLGDRIRQKEGLSYGVSSGLTVSSQDKRSGLTITAICNPQNIGRVEKAAREELERLLHDGVTQDEVEKARQGYMQALKVAWANDSALAGLLGNLRHLGRTMEFERDLQEKINSLTPDQVNAALRKHIDPAKLVIVTAGDFETKVATHGDGV